MFNKLQKIKNRKRKWKIEKNEKNEKKIGKFEKSEKIENKRKNIRINARLGNIMIIKYDKKLPKLKIRKIAKKTQKNEK